jgi:hypothetical protein
VAQYSRASHSIVGTLQNWIAQRSASHIAKFYGIHTSVMAIGDGKAHGQSVFAWRGGWGWLRGASNMIFAENLTTTLPRTALATRFVMSERPASGKWKNPGG